MEINQENWLFEIATEKDNLPEVPVSWSRETELYRHNFSSLEDKWSENVNKSNQMNYFKLFSDYLCMKFAQFVDKNDFWQILYNAFRDETLSYLFTKNNITLACTVRTLNTTQKPFAEETHCDIFGLHEARAFKVCLTEYSSCSRYLCFRNSSKRKDNPKLKLDTLS